MDPKIFLDKFLPLIYLEIGCFPERTIEFITSSEIEMRLPVLTGAGCRDNEIGLILPKNALRQFARYSPIDIIKYKKYVKGE